jgi:hypothetical protein
MTRNESFKRRIRERMAQTGERYGAARRVLLERAAARERDGWVSEPEHTDEVVRAKTGRGWDEWRELIDAWPGHADGHAAVAAWLQEAHAVPGWWAQSVTVGWERITGRRLPHQVADGTFTANRSATLAIDADAVARLLRDPEGLDALFPGFAPVLRSRPTSKNVRLGLEAGVAEISITARPDGRTTLYVSHAKLGSPDEVTLWKGFWGDWLGALQETI